MSPDKRKVLCRAVSKSLAFPESSVTPRFEGPLVSSYLLGPWSGAGNAAENTGQQCIEILF